MRNTDINHLFLTSQLMQLENGFHIELLQMDTCGFVNCEDIATIYNSQHIRVHGSRGSYR